MLVKYKAVCLRCNAAGATACKARCSTQSRRCYDSSSNTNSKAGAAAAGVAVAAANKHSQLQQQEQKVQVAA
jgi:hypothetical protein